MHKADTQGRTGSSPMARSGPSPFVAFAVAAVLALAGLGVWFLAAQGEAPKPAPAPEIEGAPAEVLTEAEAKAEFERLTRGFFSAIRSRDESDLASFATRDGELYENAAESIRTHIKDNVIDKTRVRLLEVQVLTSTATQVRLRAEELILPCFESEDGRDVTKGDRALTRKGIWILRLVDDEWLLDTGEVEESRATQSPLAGC